MAYLAFPEAASGNAAGSIAIPTLSHARQDQGASFSALEWSVIALARRDTLATLREPGRISIAMGAIFSERRNPKLADPRLETLRRMAVLSWHHGYVVRSSELRAFYAAGFDAGQYELLVDSIAVARSEGGNR